MENHNQTAHRVTILFSYDSIFIHFCVRAAHLGSIPSLENSRHSSPETHIISLSSQVLCTYLVQNTHIKHQEVISHNLSSLFDALSSAGSPTSYEHPYLPCVP
jgi:hypothetical protein